MFNTYPTEAPRDGFGRALLKAAHANPRVVALCADLAESIRVDGVMRELPDQYFEMGVAEQNMMGVAAGMALSGLIPFVCSFAVFNPGRNWDQLRVSVAYAQANVKIIGSHAGLSVGPDGATHQALEDLAITRAIPNLVVLAPTDAVEVEQAVAFAVAHKGPVYIRFGRAAVPTITPRDSVLQLGKARVLKQGTDVAICAIGAMVGPSIEAANTLQSMGISALVATLPFVKPLDTDFLTDVARTVGAFVVAEDAQQAGGLASAVAEHLSQTLPVPIIPIGVKDRFGESGTAEELYALCGLTAGDIVAAAQRAVGAKSKPMYT